LILCWDIDSRVRLGRHRSQPAELGDALRRVLRHRRGLHAYVLAWDYHPIYAMEREWLSLFKLQWNAGSRLHMHLDGDHPALASHHQKVIVVDDAVAFVGGLDPTQCRWDTPEHLAYDPRRVNEDGEPYPPFHDVQLMVSGPTARALADLARERWARATGERLAPAPAWPHAVWPAHVAPHLTNVPIGIARTEPAYRGRPEVREVERLYLDTIAAARDLIYIETQYFTSPVIAEALAARLQEPDGPDIVMLLHPASPGWLEQATMDVLRGQLLDRLRQRDPYRRLGVYYPHVPGLTAGCMTVHSKVMIVDDEIVRIGSSNLSSRSMGLDTECDMLIEARGETRVQEAIASLRNRLLGEHLGASEAEVAAALRARRSALAAVESLRGRPRTLATYENRVPPDSDTLLPDRDLLDPDRPLEADMIAERLMPPGHRIQARRRIIAGGALLLVLLGLAAAWRWTPLKAWLDIHTLADRAAAFQNTGFAPLVVPGAFIVGSLAMVPVTLLIVATVVAFGPWYGLTYSYAGIVGSALLGYWLGQYLGHDFVRQLAGSRLQRLSRQLGRHGLVTMVTVRVVPVAPFTIVNLVAGASHIALRPFVLGTLIGILPGLLALSVFANQISSALLHPGPKTWAVLAAVGATVLAVMWGLRRWLEKREP
ncbi:MAG TPA: VTT domain-containing protein, partial [Nitrospirales bacterium]|nr:VTT domain-containing protein [Nitrospirales bacterium]